MKSLVECLNESLNINEARNEFVAVFTHRTPTNVYFLKNVTPQQQRRLDSEDVHQAKITPSSNVIFISQNDEKMIWGDANINNINQLKPTLIKDIKADLESMKKGGQIYDTVYSASLDEEFYVGELEGVNTPDDLDKVNVNKIVDGIIKRFNESHISGGSSRARYFVDIKKEEKVLGSEEITVVFADLKEDEEIRHRLIGHALD
jgi:hypothetical protein